MAVSAGAGDTFDYVIVGSGAAGSVLAHRLTEEPGATVCVLEAGPPDRHPYIHVPAGFIKMLFNPDFTWQFKTEPSEGSGGRRDPHHPGAHAGRVQLDQRHGLQPRPARRSRQLGAARQPRLGLCRHAALLQAHRAADRHRRRPHPRPRGQPAGHRHRLDPPDLRGVHRRRGRHGDPALHRLQQRRPAGMASAISSARSIAAGGIRPRACSCIRRRRPDGWRSAPMPAPPRCCSMASAPSACAMSTIATGGTQHVVRARREVILSCGTANTAKLLQISGVGPAALLGSIGVPVVHELRRRRRELPRPLLGAPGRARAGTARRSTSWRAAWAWRGRSCAGRWASPASWR